MKHLFIGLVLSLVAGMSSANRSESAEAPLDISAATAVSISGESSAVDITTDPKKPYQATLERHRTGWFARWNSVWSFDDCTGASRMWLEGALLRIDVGQRTWFGDPDCRYDIRLNVRQQSAIAIHQQALQAKLSGEFSTVTLSTKAGDVALSGGADTVSMDADALRLGMTLAARQAQVVTVDARMLEADFDFTAVPALSYAVTAKMSLVDTTRKSMPGAKTVLTLTGDLVHATIH